MADSHLATIDQNGSLSLSAQAHGAIAWMLTDPPIPCVIEVIERGLVQVAPLSLWAKGEGLSESEARQRLDNAWENPDENEDASTFFREAVRPSSGRRDAGRLLPLPHMALLALFEQGSGPLKPRRGKGLTSGSVLVVVRREFIELWGRERL